MGAAFSFGSRFAAPVVTHEPALPPARVLVVDDVLEILSMFEALERFVRQRRLRFVVHASAAEAMRCLERERYDIVVSDYHLQSLNGLDVLEAAQRLQPEVPRILFTGYNELPEPEARIERLALFAHVRKPIPLLDLLQLLQQALAPAGS